jgi:hypothetical protein
MVNVTQGFRSFQVTIRVRHCILLWIIEAVTCGRNVLVRFIRVLYCRCVLLATA